MPVSSTRGHVLTFRDLMRKEENRTGKQLVAVRSDKSGCPETNE
jgi:hypothetical protein